MQVYSQNGTVATEQGDHMFKEIKSNVNKWRAYMRDKNLFFGPAQDMSWVDMVYYLYNGTTNTVTYTPEGSSAAVTVSNTGQYGYQSWTGEQIFGSYMFNYQLNTGTVRLAII